MYCTDEQLLMAGSNESHCQLKLLQLIETELYAHLNFSLRVLQFYFCWYRYPIGNPDVLIYFEDI